MAVGRLLLLISVCLVPAFAQETSKSFEPGKPVERELVGGQTRTYMLDLAANQIARSRRSNTVLISLFPCSRPMRAKLFDVDNPNGASGEEAAIIRARQSGAYRLEVRSLDKPAAVGRYAIRLDGLGPLMGAVRFFQPYLAYKEIDWEAGASSLIAVAAASRKRTKSYWP